MARPRIRVLLLLPLAWACRAGAAGAEGDAEDEVARLLRADRPAEAAALLEDRAAAAPFDSAIWVRLGDVQRVRCDLVASQDAYEHALAQDLFDPAARAGLSEVLLLQGRAEEALAGAEVGLALPHGAGDSALWRAKAVALVELRRYDLALDAARTSAAFDPTSPQAVEALARASFHAGDMAAAREAYAREVALDPDAEEANLRLGSGFGGEAKGAPWRDGEDAALFEAAVAAWDRGDADEAGRIFRALCFRAPDVYKYRLGLGVARATIRRRHEVRFGGDVTVSYLRLPGPEFEGLGRVVKGYESRPPLERHVIRVAVAPARRWWPALEKAGATHEILDLEQCLADAPDRAGLEGKRTFDGRLYEHLRGVGGKAAATGSEKLREAAEFGFNTFAHEFAHQMLEHAFPKDLAAEVKSLYATARTENRFLDYYAASNVDEYFAQGYEALVSQAKRGCLKETQRHTRAELASKDPALFEFLLRNLDLSHETPEVMEAFRAALPP